MHYDVYFIWNTVNNSNNNNYYYWEFFILVLSGGRSLESELQQDHSDLQDPSKYPW